MAIVRSIALGVSLIVAAGIGANCADASTVTIHSGNTIHVKLPTPRNSRAIQPSGSGHVARRGHPHLTPCITLPYGCNCSSGICKPNPPPYQPGGGTPSSPWKPVTSNKPPGSN